MRKPPFFVGHIPTEWSPGLNSGILLSEPFISEGYANQGPFTLIKLVDDSSQLIFQSPLSILRRMGSLHEESPMKHHGVWIMTSDETTIPGGVRPKGDFIKKFFLRSTDLGQPKTFEMIGRIDEKSINLRLDSFIYRHAMNRLIRISERLFVPA